MGKLDAKKQLKMEALLDSAFELFTSKGTSKTSISEISQQAGVAKGTFYLYFKDKYDIINKLIAHKSSKIFKNATEDMEKSGMVELSDKIIFLADNIINQLNKNKLLLRFIAKNLSWGVFKNALTENVLESDINFLEVYNKMISDCGNNISEPETMLFMIIELVSSTCYSVILYDEPVPLEKYKPHLYSAIRSIIDIHVIKE